MGVKLVFVLLIPGILNISAAPTPFVLYSEAVSFQLLTQCRSSSIVFALPTMNVFLAVLKTQVFHFLARSYSRKRVTGTAREKNTQ